MTGGTTEWPSLYSVPGSTPSHLGGRAVVGGRGMIVTPQPLAAEAGVAVLRAGGNAVDAAIAASAVLMVTAPMQCGPGGDAVWLVQPVDRPAVAVNATGRSGRSLDPEHARVAEARDGDRGGWTVTVPGAVQGWVDVLDRFGTVPLSELLQPAIELAEGGFFVSRYLHAAICVAEPVLRRSAEGQAWFLPGGVAPPVHSRLASPSSRDACGCSPTRAAGRCTRVRSRRRSLLRLSTWTGPSRRMTLLSTLRAGRSREPRTGWP